METTDKKIHTAKFDVTSDLHLDFWVDAYSAEKKQSRVLKKVISKILPESPSDNLIIAGDIGHYNNQSALFLKICLDNFYKTVTFVHGNHELYLVTKSLVKKFEHNSFNRLKDFEDQCSKIKNAFYLDGTLAVIDGIIIGGSCGWYDSFYAKKQFHLPDASISHIWKKEMHEAENIYPSEEFTDSSGYVFDWRKFAEHQYEKVKSIVVESDLIVSHIPPTYNNHFIWKEEPCNTFYQFNGHRLLYDCDGKTWIYGHTHQHHDYIHPSGCHFICHALGYPARELFIDQLKDYKFKTIEVSK